MTTQNDTMHVEMLRNAQEILQECCKQNKIDHRLAFEAMSLHSVGIAKHYDISKEAFISHLEKCWDCVEMPKGEKNDHQ